MCSGELRQVRLVLLQVVQTVDVLYVHLQLPEVLRQDAGAGVQDAPQVGFGQLLPLVQSHRAFQWFDDLQAVGQVGPGSS